MNFLMGSVYSQYSFATFPASFLSPKTASCQTRLASLCTSLWQTSKPTVCVLVRIVDVPVKEVEFCHFIRPAAGARMSGPIIKALCELRK